MYLKFRSSKSPKFSFVARSLIVQAQGDGIQLKTANKKCIHSFIYYFHNGLF